MKLKIRNRTNGRSPAGIALALVAFLTIGAFHCTQAAEVYSWTDGDGVEHFSDVPPQAGSAEILNIEDAYRPGSSGAYPDPNEAMDSDDPMAESPQSVAQQRYEQLAKDRAERKKKLEETRKLCAQNQSLLERLEPARRVYYTNEQGEEVRMDDQARVDLIEQTKDFVDKNCK